MILPCSQNYTLVLFDDVASLTFNFWKDQKGFLYKSLQME